MPKKHVHISYVEKNHIECSVCKTVAKSILYVCESGHIICKSCQKAAVDTTIQGSNEGGDHKHENKEYSIDINKKELITTNSNTTTQDLASGDHDAALVTSECTDSDTKKNSKLDDTSITKKEHCSDSPETAIEYKNGDYQDSKSSEILEIESSKNTDSNEELPNCKILPRPVVCPVTNCSKIVTIDSIMLHFHFDHSKVPRIILDDIVPQEVSLKSTTFSTEAQCVATFLIQTHKRSCKIVKKRMDSISSLRNSFKDNKLLLLMAVRLPTSPIKLPNLKYDASRVFTRSFHTQTEKINGNDLEPSTGCLSKSSSDYQSCISKIMHDEDEVLLIWLCKLDDEERVYSITLLGEDKRRGYCYIGDAAHIRDKQDPSSLYDKSECLIVKGSAINSLYDVKNQITAIVSIID